MKILKISVLPLLLLLAYPAFGQGFVGANGLSGFSFITSFTATRTLASSTNAVAIVIQSHSTGWTCAGMTAGSLGTTNGDDYLFYNLNPGTTSFSSLCNGAVSSQNTTYDVIEFSGYSVYDTGTCNSGSGAATVNLSLATANEFVIPVISDGSSSSLSSPITQISTQSFVVDGYATPSSSGPTTYNAGTSSGWNFCADAFKTGGGGGGSTPAVNKRQKLQEMQGAADLLLNLSVTPTFTANITQAQAAAVAAGSCVGAGCTHWIDICGQDDEGNSACLRVTPKLDVYQVDSDPSQPNDLSYIIGQISFPALSSALLSSGAIAP